MKVKQLQENNGMMQKNTAPQAQKPPVSLRKRFTIEGIIAFMVGISMIFNMITRSIKTDTMVIISIACYLSVIILGSLYLIFIMGRKQEQYDELAKATMLKANLIGDIVLCIVGIAMATIIYFASGREINLAVTPYNVLVTAAAALNLKVGTGRFIFIFLDMKDSSKEEE